MPDNATAMMAINVQSGSIDYFGGGIYHAMICKADNSYFSCLCQSYTSKNSFNIVFGQFQSTSWQWKPLVHESSVMKIISLQAGYNLNNLKDRCMWYGYNLVNPPTSGHSYICAGINLVYSSDWFVQIGCEISADNNIWIRQFHSGTTWTAWKKLS